MDQLRRPLSAAVLALLLVGILTAGCGEAHPPAWADSFDSPESLAGAMLGAVAAGDGARLARYALSEHELRTTVWPHLPASRPEVGMPWDYFWRDHAQRNAGHVRTILNEHGGRAYQLTGLSFEGRGTYGGVTVHRETALDVRTAAGPKRLRLSGSMVERGGRWKLYSFVAD